MIEVKQNSIGEKIAVFKCTETGQIIEKDFLSAVINPPVCLNKLYSPAVLQTIKELSM